MKDADEISILVAGDYFLSLGENEKASASNLFADLKDVMEGCDVAIVNLEAPVASNEGAIDKTGPVISLTDTSIRVLSEAGFSLATLANNHIMDFGAAGLKKTMSVCKQMGMHTVGAGDSLADARKVFTTQVINVRVAILNVAENEFSTTSGKMAGANPFDPAQNFREIQSAKKTHDHVVVIIHGGHEGYNLPSPAMQNNYRFYIDAGASCVVGHHTHCISGYELYKDCPIFYSLGNFIFHWPTQKAEDWYLGLIVKLIFNKDKLSFSLMPVKFEQQKMQVLLLDDHEAERVHNKIRALNEKIAQPDALEQEFELFVNKMSRMYRAFIEPHSNRLLHALQGRKLFPSLLSKKKRRLLLNIIRCEAHRDIVLKILKK